MPALEGQLSSTRLPCSHAVSNIFIRRRKLLTVTTAGRGFGKVQEKADSTKEARKGRKGRQQLKQEKQENRPKIPEQDDSLSVQQRFLVKSEAKAKGEDEPDVAFEKRLAAMKREAKAKLKDREVSRTDGASTLPVNILDATLDFSAPSSSASPAARGYGLPQRKQSEEQASEGFGPGQLVLGGGALILAAVFLITSFGDYGGGSSRPSTTTQQERKLGEEERRDLEKQAAAVEEQIAAGTADAEALRRAATAYSALGQDDRAAGALQQLTDKQPSDPAAWQLLVMAACLIAACLEPHSLTYLRPAEVRSRTGDHKAAVTAYKRAIAEAPSPDFALLQGLSDALVSDGRQKEAVEFLTAERKSVESGSAQGIDLIDLNLLLGRVFSQWERHDSDALAVYDAIIDKNPADFRGYLAKGVLLRRQGRKGDMQRAFLQARYNAPPEARPLLDRVIGNTNGQF